MVKRFFNVKNDTVCVTERGNKPSLLTKIKDGNEETCQYMEYILSFSKPLEFTYGFASYYHNGQMRKDGYLPYIVHPAAVAELVRSFSNDYELWQAALLHDVLEDTCCTERELELNFGSRVLSLVKACTNPSQMIDEYKPLLRAERKKIDLEHIIKHPEAHMIKACDIHHNATTSFGFKSKYVLEKLIPEKREVLKNLVISNELRNFVANAINNLEVFFIGQNMINGKVRHVINYDDIF